MLLLLNRFSQFASFSTTHLFPSKNPYILLAFTHPLWTSFRSLLPAVFLSHVSDCITHMVSFFALVSHWHFHPGSNEMCSHRFCSHYHNFPINIENLNGLSNNNDLDVRREGKEGGARGESTKDLDVCRFSFLCLQAFFLASISAQHQHALTVISLAMQLMISFFSVTAVSAFFFRLFICLFSCSNVGYP